MMNMNKLRYVLGVTVALALVAVLGFLVQKARSVNSEKRGEIISILRQLKQVDAAWDLDVLKSKTGLSSNYDAIASPLQLAKSLDVALKEQTSQVWGDAAEFKTLMDNYHGVMDKKIAAIEHFKSQNAILRNSLRFLPWAGQDLVDSVQTSGLKAALKVDVERSVNAVLTGAMAFNQAPDLATKEAVTGLIEALKKFSDKLPPLVSEKFGVFINHAEKILSQKEIGDKTLDEITTLPAAKIIDELADAYQNHYDAAMEVQQVYRQLLVVYLSLLVFLLLSYFGLRSYRLLNSKNQELRKVNEQLNESQVALIQVEKMSALGQMVAGVAHEVNTPLAYVKGTLGLVAEYAGMLNDLAKRASQYTSAAQNPDSDKTAVSEQLAQLAELARNIEGQKVMPELEGLLKDGLHSIEQIAEIILNLKNFSRLDRAKVSSFSVEEGLDSALMIARNLLKNKVEIKKEYGGTSKITCSPSQINQVFLNIISNAAHAIPVERMEMGQITLRTQNEGDNMVRIEIQDNGSGISRDVLPKIFDPFFTTKEVGKGSGMGLSISYKIIQEHGGQIQVKTEEGIGTVFSILLPVNSAQETGAKAQAK
jgi:signal transduction histidine kinase